VYNRIKEEDKGDTMKPGRIIGFLLGSALIYFSVGAYLSNEAAAQTDTGRIMIFVAGALGFLMVIGNLFPAKSSQMNQTVTTQPPPLSDLTCPACQKPIEKAFHHCPHCGVNLHPICPNCKKEVSVEFKVCPYCATTLKEK
jgi:hypothetical protein